MAEVYIATTDAVVQYEGDMVSIRKNVTRIEEGHPIHTAHPEFFMPVGEGVHFPVRNAKAEPRTVARKKP